MLNLDSETLIFDLRGVNFAMVRYNPKSYQVLTMVLVAHSVM